MFGLEHHGTSEPASGLGVRLGCCLECSWSVFGVLGVFFGSFNFAFPRGVLGCLGLFCGCLLVKGMCLFEFSTHPRFLLALFFGLRVTHRCFASSFVPPKRCDVKSQVKKHESLTS